MMKVLLAALLVVVAASEAASQNWEGKGSIYSDGMDTSGVTASVRTYVVETEAGPHSSSSSASNFGPGQSPGLAAEILPLSCLGSSVNAGAFVVSLNKNSCVAAATPEPPTPDPAAPLPSPLELAWIAADRAMSLAEWPELRVAPRRIGLTGLPTFVWLRRSPRPVTASASVPGVTVTALAEPVEFRWDFGEGATRKTSHSGRAWTRRRDGNISHTYERRGSRELGVDVVWQARWRINTGAWQHLGYFSNHDSRSYRVRQMVAMLSRTRGR